jgi:hypothetical protein
MALDGGALDQATFDVICDDASMNFRCKPFLRFRPLFFLPLLACVACLCGCRGGRTAHSLDPRLRTVDEMLSANIREGMTRAQVLNLLKSRGYQFEARPDMASLRVVVRHVDADTLQPVVAHATFHFDPYDKLVSFELQLAPDLPFQP